MFGRMRRVLLVGSVVAVLACAVVATSTTPALAYGKATWQTALTGTFTFPASDFFGLTGEGFWGWCDFAGGMTSGDDADCQISEYMHSAAGSGWTCELSIDGSWTQGPEDFDPISITCHMTGSLVTHGHLTAAQKAACANFFTGRTDGSTSFVNADTFIPAAPGHYAIPPGVIFPPGTNVVGEFNFTVELNPTA